jgi:hypothetical protein
MDKLTRQFFGDAKKVALHPSEKAQVWDQISMRASSSPVKLSSLEKAESYAGITRYMQSNPLKIKKHPLQHFFALHRMGAMAMCAVLLMGAGGGGAVYAAEDAMPEDILYPVKLHVNERFMGAMHRTPERKVQWEQRRLGRRLAEAEHLSQYSGLTKDRREMLEQRIEKRVESFQEHIDRVPEEKRVVLEEKFQERFEKHQEFLEKLDSGEINREETQKFKKRMLDVHSRVRKPGNIHPKKELRLEQTTTSRKRMDIQNRKNVAPQPSREMPLRGQLRHR